MFANDHGHAVDLYFDLYLTVEGSSILRNVGFISRIGKVI